MAAQSRRSRSTAVGQGPPGRRPPGPGRGRGAAFAPFSSSKRSAVLTAAGRAALSGSAPAPGWRDAALCPPSGTRGTRRPPDGPATDDSPLSGARRGASSVRCPASCRSRSLPVSFPVLCRLVSVFFAALACSGLFAASPPPGMPGLGAQKKPVPPRAPALSISVRRAPYLLVLRKFLARAASGELGYFLMSSFMRALAAAFWFILLKQMPCFR